MADAETGSRNIASLAACNALNTAHQKSDQGDLASRGRLQKPLQRPAISSSRDLLKRAPLPRAIRGVWPKPLGAATNQLSRFIFASCAPASSRASVFSDSSTPPKRKAVTHDRSSPSTLASGACPGIAASFAGFRASPPDASGANWLWQDPNRGAHHSARARQGKARRSHGSCAQPD